MCRSTVFYNFASPNCSHGYSFEVGSSIEETNPLGADSAKALLIFLLDFILLFQTSRALSYISPCEQFDKRERMSIVHFSCTKIRQGLAP